VKDQYESRGNSSKKCHKSGKSEERRSSRKAGEAPERQKKGISKKRAEDRDRVRGSARNKCTSASKCEDNARSTKLQGSRGITEARAEMGQPEGTDIPRFFDRLSENKRKDKNRNILKKKRDRNTKHERRIDIDT
jgi:hypothetical protein